jgi:UDP-N-acetylglucosamine 2-epimerase
MKKCETIVTDSGGNQEEATAPSMRKRVLVTRFSTERPEAAQSGFAEVVGTGKQKTIEAIKKALECQKELPIRSPYGDGDAAEKIVKIIKHESEAQNCLTRYT